MNQLRPEPRLALIHLVGTSKMSLPKLCNFVEYHRIPTKVLNGLVTIDRTYAIQILKWTRSCGVSKVARVLRVRDSMPKKLLEQGRLRGEMIFGKMRISLKSVEDLKKEGVYDSSVAFPNRQGFARFSDERLREISRQAGKTKRKLKPTPRKTDRRKKRGVEKKR